MGSRRGLAVIQAELRRRTSGRGRRYSPELKQRIVSAVAKLRAEGVDWREAGELLGVPWQTLVRWSNGVRGASPRMRPVRVAEAPSSAPLTITTPTGLRIDGASLDDVARLLRALG